MPEGDIVRRLADRFSGLIGERWETDSPQGKFTAGAAELSGRTLSATDARGKHLFLELDGPWLHIHLGRFGRFDWLSAEAEPGPSVRLRILRPGGDQIHLSGAMVCEAVDAGRKSVIQENLGVDPLRAAEEPVSMVAWWIAESARPIGAILMYQDVFAGVGNIHRADALHRAGVNPHRPGSEITPEELDRIWEELIWGMETGVARGHRQSLLRPGVEPRAVADGRDRVFYVYGRAGRPCHSCGTEIAAEELEGRRLYWCPSCQT